MKKYLYATIALTSYLLLTSFLLNPKPHLIVGCWELIDSQKNNHTFILDEKEFLIKRISFGSDEITSTVDLSKKGKKNEEELKLGFHIFEPFDEYKNQILLLKDICNNKTRIVFSILYLDKEFMKLKFEEKDSENVNIEEQILTFERTAGPPENIQD